MHEYSVASELVSSLLPVLKQHHGAVKRVFLKKGELRILSDRALANAFDVMKQGTPLEGATLCIEAVAAHVVCDACGFEGAPEHLSDEAMHFSVPILSCPRCARDVRVTQGRELFVDRLTLDVQSGEEHETASGSAAHG